MTGFLGWFIGVLLVAGSVLTVVGISIVVVGRVPGPGWLFGRVEDGDTARARLIGWQAVTQGVLPVLIATLNLTDGLGDVVEVLLIVLILAVVVGSILINRRRGAPDRQRW